MHTTKDNIILLHTLASLPIQSRFVFPSGIGHMDIYIYINIFIFYQSQYKRPLYFLNPAEKYR